MTRTVLILTLLGILVIPEAALGAVDVTRASLSGGRLSIDGRGAERRATVTATSPESSARARASRSGTFRISSRSFESSTCTVTVSDGSSSTTAELSGCTTSTPAPPPAPAPAPVQETVTGSEEAGGTLSNMAVSPSTVTGGQAVQGTATLAAPATAATTVALSSTDTSVAVVPTSVTVPAGALSATFPVETRPVSGAGTFAVIMGSAGGVSRGATLNVNPAPAGPSLASLTFSPSTVAGGSPATGTVTFSARTDGAVVRLQSSNPAVVSVPSETVVAGGQSTGSFPVTTSAVATATPVTVTASAFGVTRSATLTVSPDVAPPAADTVRITRASFRRGILRVEATSTNPSAILRVYQSPSDSFLMQLTNLGGGRYAGERARLTNPRTIVVRSNLGGSATART